ncbi:MAG: hypothetical protein KDJ22_02320 [Candidatus Competibacteraceae bacterium]|nr:hypothetical protein [Candidatus Competibacteraceae bacterium]MCP5124893.1 hypothetical protein [Gammaproteobacteria bacterium]HRX70999.1 hypothetical protein [Candidatus Competibacteraceae bacterium]
MNLNDLTLEQTYDLLNTALAADEIPPPDAYADDGRPLWSLAVLAAFFGKTELQIEADLDAAFDRWADVTWSGPAQRMQ